MFAAFVFLLNTAVTDPLIRVTHDIAVLTDPPASPTDPKVPTAEELALNSKILAQAIARTRLEQGWRNFPALSFSQTRRLTISNGQAIVAYYPGVLDLNTSILIPDLPSAGSTIQQTDYVLLVAFNAEIGKTQDPVLGQMTFKYRNQNTKEITPITKENTLRLRAFWGLVLSPTPLSANDFLNLLTLDGDYRKITIFETSEIGFTLGTSRFYARDNNFLLNAIYPILPDTVNVIELAQVRRIQNFTNRGYTWGYGGEGALNTAFHIVSTAPRFGAVDLESAMRQRLRQIFAGQPGAGFAFSRSVQNLSASSVGNNPGYPGESAGSPNGSVCLANDQRITFTNQATIQTLSCQVVTATNNGSGSPLVAVSLNTNSPTGSFFSGNRADHRIFSSDGVDQTDRGSFSNLGGTGTLAWIGDANTTITPGQTVYVAPGIFYPSGSGLNLPFEAVEQVWQNAAQISTANIRAADYADLDAYVDPANNEDYVIVCDRARSALQYILKRVSVVSDGSGVARIPLTEKGCFAFIQGVSGRIDAPVKAGLTPNTTYKALIYAPPSAATVWQFLVRYAEYQGTGATEAQFLNGATIISKPLFYIHTQGGGGSTHQGEADTGLSPISMHLPDVVNPSIPSYRFNAPIHLTGDPYPGPITLQEQPLLPAPGLALPAPGQVITLQAAGTAQARSLQTRLMVGGRTLGFRSPMLASKLEFQAILAFVAEKAGERRLVIATHNTLGGENISVDSDQQTAIDTFRLTGNIAPNLLPSPTTIVRNPRFFPADFPSSIPGVTSEQSALESTIDNIQTQARDTAVKQAHTRRISAQMAISLQNRHVLSVPSLMPLYRVGPQVQTAPFLGTAAYLGGGRGYVGDSVFDNIVEMPYSNEAFVGIGTRLTAPRAYSGCVGDLASGRFCGGTGNKSVDPGNTTDEFVYLRRSLNRIASQLSQSLTMITGGIGDRTKGILLGGLTASGVSTQIGHRLTYSTNVFASLGSTYLPVSRLAPNQGLCSKTAGYNCGGVTQRWGTPLTSISRVTLSNETIATIGTALANPHVVHAAFGYDVKGYLAGGSNTNPPTSNWFSSVITALTFSGETVATLGAALADAKVCADGAGSSIRGYVIGGDTAVSNWGGTRTVDGLTYSSEAIARLGAQLPTAKSDQGAVSDYGAGFNY